MPNEIKVTYRNIVYAIPAAHDPFDVMTAYEKYHCLPMTAEDNLRYQTALGIIRA